jgi:hypothetical protein
VVSDDFTTSPDAAPSASAIDAFIAEANSAFPALKLTGGDVTLVHRGVVPRPKAPADGRRIFRRLGSSITPRTAPPAPSRSWA